MTLRSRFAGFQKRRVMARVLTSRPFEPSGKPRLIEVKTTNGWERTPFYISANEA